MNNLNLKSLNHPLPGLKKSFLDFFGLGLATTFFVPVLFMLGFFLAAAFADFDDGTFFALVVFDSNFGLEEDFLVVGPGLDLELALDLDFEESAKVGFGGGLGV